MNNDELTELRNYYDKTDVADEFANAELNTRATATCMTALPPAPQRTFCV